MKVVGMLVVSLRSVNIGFWSHLGCSGKTPSYLAVRSRLGLQAKKYKNITYNVVSFRGQKKLGPHRDRSPSGV